MFYGDNFDPTLENDSESKSSDRKNKKKVEQELKNDDKHYFKYTKPFNDTWTDGRFYKKVTIELYGSRDIGSRIRNAVTGQLYPPNFIVGTSYEDLLFTVSECSGINKHREPIHLYYDSPEQYENHQFLFVDQGVKNKWNSKNLEAKKRYKLI